MKKYLLYLAMLFAVGLTSCDKDRGLGNDGTADGTIPDGYGAVQLAIKTPPAPKATTPGTTAENAVDNVYVYVFQGGKLETTLLNVKAADFETGTNDLNGYSYKTLNLEGVGIRHIYVIANADQQKLEAAGIKVGYKESDFLALKTAAITDGKAIKAPLLMTAVSGEVNVLEGILTTCKLDLKRAVARFDIKVTKEAGKEAEPFFEIVSARVINARTQINLLPQDAHDEAPATNPALANLESVVNTDPALADRGDRLVSMTGQIYAYENLFMVDADGKQVPTQWELDNATTIEVTGNRLKWKDGAVEQTTSATYVVNFVSVVYTGDKVTARTPVQIDRNNLYTITLKPGKESDIDNTVTIDEWEDGDITIDTEAGDGLADIKASDIAPDFDAVLVTYSNGDKEKPAFKLAPAAVTTIDIYVESGVQPKLKYKAATGVTLTDFVKVTPGATKAADKHPVLTDPDKMLFMAQVKVDETMSNFCTFQVVSTKGKPGKTYSLYSMTSPANAFMVKPGESVSFDPTIKGNSTTADLATERVELLWQDAPGIVTAADLTFVKALNMVTVNPKKAGNAVIVAKNAGGEILWSWHIWATDYQPAPPTEAIAENTAYAVTGGEVHTYGTSYMAKNPGKVIMDRNLGATKSYYEPVPAGTSAEEVSQCFGLMYQWGRKDPFPGWDGVDANAKASVTLYGADGTTDVTTTAYQNVAGPVSVETAIANPGNFYYATAAPYDWNSTQNDALWGGATGAAKSPFDPCPEGWRIAPNGTWSDFTRGTAAGSWTDGTFPYYSSGTIAERTTTYLNSNGRYYNQGSVKVWYPAPGFRDSGYYGKNGALMDVGYGGCSWSSSVSTTDGVYLNFHSTSLNPSYVDYRGFGLPVRCVQE